MVEIFVSVIDRAAIRRRVFTLVKDFNSKIRAFINGWNRRCHPFTWI
jgi:ISMsm5, transposase